MDLRVGAKLVESVRVFEARLEDLDRLVAKFDEYPRPTAEQKVALYEALVSYHQMLEQSAEAALVCGLSDMSLQVLKMRERLQTIGAHVETR